MEYEQDCKWRTAPALAPTITMTGAYHWRRSSLAKRLRAPITRGPTIISTNNSVKLALNHSVPSGNLINGPQRRWNQFRCGKRRRLVAVLVVVACWWLAAKAHLLQPTDDHDDFKLAPIDDDLMELVKSSDGDVDGANLKGTTSSPHDRHHRRRQQQHQRDNQDSIDGSNPVEPITAASNQSTWSMLMAALFEYRASGSQQASPPSSSGDIYDDPTTTTGANDNNNNQPMAASVNVFNLVVAILLVLLMLTTAIGNLFVIVAILIERNLRTLGNYLVLSLAIADLLVALLVMPLASIYLILDSWTLGVRLCDIWTSADVFCCTASILHLLAIALDRYWAVTRVDYIRCQRNDRRILSMIFCVWMAAGVISLAPAFGWKDAEYEERILINKECLISQDIGYQIFATCTTFYFPLTLTLIFYWKIYQVARKRIRRKLNNRAQLKPPHPSSTSSGSIALTASGNKPKQITKNQSIVKYSQRPGAAAKFTTSSTSKGPVQLQGTISATTANMVPVTNRPSPSACECHCHKSNQAQSNGTKSEEWTGAHEVVGQKAAETGTSSFALEPAPSLANSKCQALQLDGGKRPTTSPSVVAAEAAAAADDKVVPGDGCEPIPKQHLQQQQQQQRDLDRDDKNAEGAQEVTKQQHIVDFSNNNHNSYINNNNIGKWADGRTPLGELDATGDHSERTAHADPLGSFNNNNTSETITGRRQSNLNSACPRCKRNQFQESQSVSLASCSRASSLQANEYGGSENHNDGRPLAATNRNYSSLSSTNCTHGLLLMDTSSLDGSDQINAIGRKSVAADATATLAGARAMSAHRKSLGVAVSRRLSTNCECCACAVCCQDQSLAEEELERVAAIDAAADDDERDRINQEKTTTGQTSKAVVAVSSAPATTANATDTVTSQSSNHQPEGSLPERLDNQRSLAVTLNKAGRMSCGLIQPTSQVQAECSLSMAGCQLDNDATVAAAAAEVNLDGDTSEEGPSGALANTKSWLAAATRRLVKRRLGPLEPFRKMVAICWRHLLVATRAQFRGKQQQQHKQEQPFESAADVMATDQHSTSVLIHHGNAQHQTSPQSDNDDMEAEAPAVESVCKACQCPLLMERLASRSVEELEDEATSAARQVVVTVGQIRADSANLAAAVATTTTIALSTSDGLNQRGVAAAAEKSSSAYSLGGGGNSKPTLEGSPGHKSRLYLMQQQHSLQSSPTIQSQAAQMEGVESKRERKAAKTLAIITGVFVMCWLPFFIMAIAMPLLQLKPHKYLFAFLLWLGYINSMLNPIIYTIFSPDFRKAFKRLLCGSDDEKAQRKKRRAYGGASSSAILSNGNGNGNGMGCQTGRPSNGYLVALLNQCLCCRQSWCNKSQTTTTVVNSNQWSHQLERHGTTRPNSLPRNIPDKPKPSPSSMNCPNRPKSIITNHF